MKKIILIFTVLLFSCSKKEQLNSNSQKISADKKELDSNFRKVIVNYQKTYPVKNPKRGNIYIYVAAFSKEQNDTIFTITRTSAGIISATKNIYGLYRDDELKNFVLYDELKLSVNQVKIYKKELPDSLILKSSDVFSESITPVSKFKIINKVPKFVRIDTVWNHWD